MVTCTMVNVTTTTTSYESYVHTRKIKDQKSRPPPLLCYRTYFDVHARSITELLFLRFEIISIVVFPHVGASYGTRFELFFLVRREEKNSAVVPIA